MTDQGFGDGIQLALDQIDQLTQELDKQLPPAALAAADLLQAEAQRQAPKDTGRLARSIESELVEAGQGEALATVKVGEFYGRFLEYGTAKMAARPFLRSAAHTKRRAMGNAIKDEIKILGVKIRSFKR